MNKYLAWYKTWKCLPVLDFVAAWDLAYLRDFCSAAKKFERGLENHPTHIAAPEARYALAQCYRRLYDFGAFQRTLEESIRLDSNFQQPYLSLAKLHLLHGSNREAARILKTSLRIFGADRESSDLLCLALLRSQAPLGLVERSLKEFSISLQELSSVPRILYELRFGLLSRARALLDLRFQSDDESEDERLLYATFCLEQGKILFARQLLKELFQQNPRCPEITFRLAQSFAEENRFEDLDAALQFALEASRLSHYKHAGALELAHIIYKQKNENFLSELFAAKYETAKPLACYDIPAKSRASSNGTLSA